ncbi:helicase Cas3 [Methanobrevibacter cuticularis]|uniref:Helicase Cas3 n=1 Tax=Methanobrevibacter cuticularis TaxID=47311 RepID=A0A166ETN3_9EURY|nr:CRISPR-associated helicase/endonuclease Cas3 [Methanobrevibacter cuticularis]KZX16999.1 helicase Cas3 [Methanobrevibacter cuticularis]
MDINDLKFNKLKSSFNVQNDELKLYGHEDELLIDHLEKTKLIFNKIVDDNLIKQFYEYFYNDNALNVSYEQFLSIIEKMIEFHDIGKISFNFQINRLNKYNSKIKKEQTDILNKYDLYKHVNDIEADHSLTSSILFTSYLFKNYDLEDNLLLILLAYIIYGHHTKIKDVSIEEDFSYDLNRELEKTFDLFSKFTCSNFYPYADYQDIQDSFVEEYLNSDEINSLNNKLSFFYSYIYSALISADVIASSYYNKSTEKINIDSWNNRIDKKHKTKMYDFFHKIDINTNLKELGSLDELNFSEDIKDINVLRKNMLLESSFVLNNSLEKFPSNKIFFLNMPTGGGKTNTSMKLALEILKNTKVDRIIYAMPFINIIEQNYDIIRDNFGLSDETGEIRKIYSGSESIFPDTSEEYKSETIIKDDFFDYPVICTTFVSLFNSLIKNKKKHKYSFSHLANSVIILDEIQSLPLKNWSSLYYLINELSENLNVYFIIMSATLPDFGSLKLDMSSGLKYDSVQLIENHEKYFNHPLFKRTNINSKVKELDTDNLSEFTSYFSKIINNNFKIGFNKGLIVLNTIKTSKFVFKYINSLGNKYGFNVELLNSTIIPSERMKIINRINDKKNKGKYILVSTQSIEAGVDVSFDFVVRDFSVLDSIEQVRGRCNRSRELNKQFQDENKKGNVYITNIKRKGHFECNYIYKEEERKNRLNESMKILDNNINYEYVDILKYYDNISKNINNMHENKEENFVFKDLDNIISWKILQYSEILNKYYGIHIIDKRISDSFSFFVSTNINISVKDSIFVLDDFEKLYNKRPNDFIFSYNEIKYLNDCEKKYNLKLIENNAVIGHNLINLYEILYKNSDNFINKKIIQKEFSSILYKFIFQVSNNDIEDIISSEKLKNIGYFHIIPEDKIGEGNEKIYSLKTGFNFSFEVEEHDWEIQ